MDAEHNNGQAASNGRPKPRVRKPLANGYYSRERNYKVKAEVIITMFGDPAKETGALLEDLQQILSNHYNHVQVLAFPKKKAQTT